jgi:hypothetical protein
MTFHETPLDLRFCWYATEGTILWDVMLCSSVDIFQHFGRTCSSSKGTGSFQEEGGLE